MTAAASLQSRANDAWHDVFSFNGDHSHVTIPHYLNRLIEAAQRDAEAAASMRRRADAGDGLMVWDDVIDIDLDLEKKSGLAAFEDRVADKLAEVADWSHPELFKLASEMRLCRREGHVGITPDGKYRVAWSSKCGSAVFCPHESREEMQRITRRYQGPFHDFLDRNRLHELHYSVLTIPNVPGGELRAGIDYLFKRFKAVFLDKCPAVDNIEGAIAVVECPWSRRADWNIHLNVFFLTRGWIDYKLMRRCWGYDMSVQRVERANIARTFRELIKYVFTGDAEKSCGEDEGEGGAEVAPSFFHWPADSILEYVDALRGMRRTRSYGCLYAVHRRQWDLPGLAVDKRLYHRTRILTDALTWSPDLSSSLISAMWTDIPEETKRILRRAMDDGPAPARDIKWIGRVTWAAPDASYRVDLLPEDNFFSRSPKTDNFQTGPPARGSGP